MRQRWVSAFGRHRKSKKVELGRKGPWLQMQYKHIIYNLQLCSLNNRGVVLPGMYLPWFMRQCLICCVSIELIQERNRIIHETTWIFFGRFPEFLRRSGLPKSNVDGANHLPPSSTTLDVPIDDVLLLDVPAQAFCARITWWLRQLTPFPLWASGVRCETISTSQDGCRKVRCTYIFALCCEDVHKSNLARPGVWPWEVEEWDKRWSIMFIILEASARRVVAAA